MSSELALSMPAMVADPQPSTLRRFLWHLKDHVIPHPRNNYHPHLLGHRTLALFSILLLSAKIASIVVLTIGPAQPVFSSDINANNVISLTNASRIEAGLGALNSNSKLTAAASAKAQALLECQCFSHNIGEKTPWDFIKAQGYDYLMAGENLAVNYVTSESLNEAWMNSAGHRANILNTNFEEIGIGIISGKFQGGDSIIVVQMFGLPAEQTVAISPKPTAVAAPKVADSAAAETQKKTLAPRSAEAALPPVALAPDAKPVEAAPQETLKPSIVNNDLSRDGDSLKITVTTEGNVSKVVASYGKQGLMLEPKSDNVWQGSVPISKLADGESQLTLTAYDMAGAATATRVASFSQSLTDAFAPIQQPNQKQLQLFGHKFDPRALAQNFYLLFVAGLLGAMILAIGIKRHIQHVHMIANGSFVVILAILLWQMG